MRLRGFLNLGATAVVAADAALAQSEAFEVASVKVYYDDGVSPRNFREFAPQGVRFGGCALAFIIGEAYNFPVGRIVGPDSFTKEALWPPLSQGYDIVAKAGREASKDEIRRMLQLLLAERFRLTFHRESKTERVYRLVVAAGGPHLGESHETEGGFSSSGGPDGFVFRNTEMMRLSGFLSGRVDRVVVDETGLKGTYSFALKMPPEWQQNRIAKSEGLSPDSPSAAAFADSLKQLGLQLIPGTAAVEYLVVDRVEKPTAN